jgi:hypothetical protein
MAVIEVIVLSVHIHIHGRDREYPSFLSCFGLGLVLLTEPLVILLILSRMTKKRTYVSAKPDMIYSTSLSTCSQRNACKSVFRVRPRCQSANTRCPIWLDAITLVLGRHRLSL